MTSPKSGGHEAMERAQETRERYALDLAQQAIASIGSFDRGLQDHYLAKLKAVHALASSQPPSELVESLVQDIHGVLKRGTATEDHGLVGNLRCILDAVLAIKHPISDPFAAPPLSHDLDSGERK